MIKLATIIHLVLFELCSYSPSLVVGECVSVLLEQGIDPGYTTIPTVLEILQSKTTILGVCLLTFQRVLSPDTLGIYEL